MAPVKTIHTIRKAFDVSAHLAIRVADARSVSRTHSCNSEHVLIVFFSLKCWIAWIVGKNASMEANAFNVLLAITFVPAPIPTADFVASHNDRRAVLVCRVEIQMHQWTSFVGMMSAIAPTTTTVSSASACSTNLCNNRGLCQQVGYGTGIQCFCSSGWSGSRCQYSKLTFHSIRREENGEILHAKQRKTSCIHLDLSCKDEQQCRNGGVCRDVTDDISICHCSAQFWGERCE